MQSPFELDNIENVKAYYIDSNDFNLFQLKAGSNLVGSAYKNAKVIRSLLLKYNNLNSKLVEKLYPNENDDEVIFILNYSNSEKYFMSFQIEQKSEDEIDQTLSKIKNEQANIIDWFRNKLDNQDILDDSSDLEIFPSYPIPLMPAVVNLGEDFKYVKISSIELTKIKVQSEEEISSLKQLNFKVGKKEHQIQVLDYSFEEIENEKYEYTLQINFTDLEFYNSWSKFILNMDIISKTKKSS